MNNAHAVHRSLDAIAANHDIPHLPITGKYVILGDAHKGDGGPCDDSAGNEEALCTALRYYNNLGFTAIINGDWEELWQFSLQEIVREYYHRSYFELRKFPADRLYRIAGNHDDLWEHFTDPTKGSKEQRDCKPQSFPAVALVDDAQVQMMLILHGHQGDWRADRKRWNSRFWVRVFRETKLEPLVKKLGLYSHSSATKSSIIREHEQIFYSWAKERGVVLILNHTHRAIFGSRSYADKLHDQVGQLQRRVLKNPLDAAAWSELKDTWREYLHEKLRNRVIDPLDPDGIAEPIIFNAGCWVYSDGGTVVEMEKGIIRLVKWNRKGKRTMYDHMFYSTFSKIQEVE